METTHAKESLEQHYETLMKKLAEFWFYEAELYP